MTIVIVSGFFDPLHVGHLELIEEAQELGNVIIIVNNDKQTKAKKGYVFMPEEDRIEILSHMRNICDIYISIDKDKSVCKTIQKIVKDHPPTYKFIFFNAGDRSKVEVPEKKVCDKLGIYMVDGFGKKISSSSDLVEKAIRQKGIFIPELQEEYNKKRKSVG